MKKILALSLALLFVLFAAGCGNSAEKEVVSTVESAFTALQEGDMAAAQQYFIVDDSIQDYLDEELDDELAENDTVNEMGKLLFSNLQYEIKSSKVDGDAATVTADITNYDMSEILETYLTEVITTAFEYAFMSEDEQPSDEEMEQIYVDLLEKCMTEKDVELVTTSMDIELTQQDGAWKINASEEFADAVMGGAISALEAFSDELSFNLEDSFDDLDLSFDDTADDVADYEIDYDDWTDDTSSNVYIGEGAIGDSYVVIKDVFVIDDAGTPVLIVDYDWTNNSDETTSAWMALDITAFQDGVSLDVAFPYDDDVYDSSLEDKDVRPGVTLSVQKAFELSNTTSSVEIEIESFFNWDNNDIVYQEFELQ